MWQHKILTIGRLDHHGELVNTWSQINDLVLIECQDGWEPYNLIYYIAEDTKERTAIYSLKKWTVED